MELYIKNMVCDRCIMVVRQQLDILSIPYTNVELGEVKLTAPVSEEQFLNLKDQLHLLGFELLDDKKASLVTQIKSIIIRHIHTTDNPEVNLKLSALLAVKLNLDYNYLSALFSAVEGITIEKYCILQRIERAKELLDYNEMSLNEIADALCYSSVQHLSQQFKKVTGLTPSQYKQTKEVARKSLDQVGS